MQMTNHDLHWRVMDSLAWGMSTWADPGLRAPRPIEQVLVFRVQRPSGELFDALQQADLLFYQEYIQLRTMATLQTQRRGQEAIAASRAKAKTTNKEMDGEVRFSHMTVHLRFHSHVDRDVTLLLLKQVGDAVAHGGGRSTELATR